MSKRGNGYGSETRVNILKKVKVGKNWNLYPVGSFTRKQEPTGIQSPGRTNLLHAAGADGNGHDRNVVSWRGRLLAEADLRKLRVAVTERQE